MGEAGWSMRTGAAIFIAVAALGGVALARGPDMLLPTAAEPGPNFYAPSVHSGPSQADDGDHVEKRRAHKHRLASAAVAGRVCVRLCDGFFFPDSGGAGGDETCEAQCPDAPVALYSMPSDRIADAVSVTTGAPYSALPVANRHETTFDATCTCHRNPGASRTAELLHDPTLRRGDLVMTAEGFKVFEGARGATVDASDFVALARATNVTRDQRAALVAMERAPAPSPRLRGTVTVDDGLR